MPPKILVVEDNESIRLVVRMTLEMGNYEVIEAEDGQQGIERLKQHSDFALVITDLAMPVMDGYQLLDYIRNDMRRRDLPVFVLSAEKDASAALDCGGTCLIRKPFSPVELLESVKRAIPSGTP
jgi:CheY-like chemotaxis protein